MEQEKENMVRPKVMRFPFFEIMEEMPLDILSKQVDFIRAKIADFFDELEIVLAKNRIIELFLYCAIKESDISYHMDGGDKKDLGIEMQLASSMNRQNFVFNEDTWPIIDITVDRIYKEIFFSECNRQIDTRNWDKRLFIYAIRNLAGKGNRGEVRGVDSVFGGDLGLIFNAAVEGPWLLHHVHNGELFVYNSNEPQVVCHVILKEVKRDLNFVDVNTSNSLKNMPSYPGLMHYFGNINLANINGYDSMTFVLQEKINCAVNLLELFQSNKLSNLDDRLFLLENMAQSLTAFYERGFYHNDIKPANYLLSQTSDRRVVLCDYDTVTMKDDPRCVMGEGFFMAPEKFLQSKVQDNSDLYSFGVCLCEFLFYKRPRILNLSHNTYISPEEFFTVVKKRGNISYVGIKNFKQLIIQVSYLIELDYKKRAKVQDLNLIVASIIDLIREKEDLREFLNTLVVEF